MLTLEQVSKRVFSDSSWFLKSAFGTFLLIVPIAHFWAFGYMYRVALMGRLGNRGPLPDWEDWRGLFIDGFRFFAIVVIWAVIPILLAWLASLPLSRFLGPLSYMPMAPVLLLAAPLVAASTYRYQRREEFRDALRFDILFKMVVSARERLVVPTLAYIGLLFVLSPIFPYALFTGGMVIFYYYTFTFKQLEAAGRESTSSHSLIRR
jgi:hypothetical protein